MKRISTQSPVDIADDKFVREEMAWRERRDKEMRAPTSWLAAIAGHFWLKEGENSFGSSRSNAIVFPDGSAPSTAGRFILHEEKVTIIANGDTPLIVGGKRISQATLRSDDSGKPDVVELNYLRFWVIKRNKQFAIRLRDLNNPPYKSYKGLDFFQPNRKYKIEADFMRFPTPRKITLETVAGTKDEKTATGYASFAINGQPYRLESLQSPFNHQNELFFIFKDETNGRETYEASRFMECKFLPNGKIDLNFNRVYNPPCAYTEYAVCPFPPPQNHMKIRIEAGEKKYHQNP